MADHRRRLHDQRSPVTKLDSLRYGALLALAVATAFLVVQALGAV